MDQDMEMGTDQLTDPWCRQHRAVRAAGTLWVHEQLIHLVTETAKMPTEPLFILLWGRTEVNGDLGVGEEREAKGNKYY